MKRYFRIMLVFALCVLALTACTDKAKDKADKLTSDIVDYTQQKVNDEAGNVANQIQDAFNNAKDYIKDNAGDISEQIMDGLTNIAKDVKDEAEGLGGEIKNDLSNNINGVKDDVKDNIKEGLDNIKDSLDDVKDSFQNALNQTKEDAGDAIDNAKDAVEGAKEDINDAVSDVKEEVGNVVDDVVEYINYRFRNYKLLDQHYEKHGKEMGFADRESYEKAASDVINNPAALHKIEKEDGDYVYYVEATNEFVILSTDGYIRTYFLPSGGKKYYDRQ